MPAIFPRTEQFVLRSILKMNSPGIFFDFSFYFASQFPSHSPEKAESPVKCVFIACRFYFFPILFPFHPFLNNNSFGPQSEGQLKCPLSVSAILINMKKAASKAHMYS